MNAPTPYQGKEKYIFISYSHRDTAKVFPIIFALMDEGYRVWYDQGIDPGTEWDENIAMHINDCGYFIAFMSSNYLGSSNCKDELNYARDLEKDRLIVYLEDVKLPAGMAMRVNRLQSIFKHTYVNEKDFYDKLFAANNINVCLAEKKPAEEKKEEPAPAPIQPKVTPLSGGTDGAGTGYVPHVPPSNTGYSQPGYRPGGFNPNPGQSQNTGAAPGFNPNPGQSQNTGAAPGFNPNPGFAQNPAGSINNINEMTYPVKNKMLAVILAFFLGSVGVHKFYLGQKLQGILYIAFVWTYIPVLLGLIDAILMLTMTDETFKQKFKCRLS